MGSSQSTSSGTIRGCPLLAAREQAHEEASRRSSRHAAYAWRLVQHQYPGFVKIISSPLSMLIIRRATAMRSGPGSRSCRRKTARNTMAASLLSSVYARLEMQSVIQISQLPRQSFRSHAASTFGGIRLESPRRKTRLAIVTTTRRTRIN